MSIAYFVTESVLVKPLLQRVLTESVFSKASGLFYIHEYFTINGSDGL